MASPVIMVSINYDRYGMSEPTSYRVVCPMTTKNTRLTHYDSQLTGGVGKSNPNKDTTGNGGQITKAISIS
jgi:hypothetical protein